MSEPPRAAPWPDSPTGSLDMLACALNCSQRAEADHRIANQLAMLSGYMRLKAAEFDRSELTERRMVQLFVQSIDAQILGMVRLQRLIVAQGREPSVQLSALLEDVTTAFGSATDRRILLRCDAPPDLAVSREQALALSQFIVEAITNAAKYAHPGNVIGLMVIRCWAVDPDRLVLELSDDGRGLPDGFDVERDGGFGFNLLREIGRDLRASLKFSSGPGGLRLLLDLPRLQGI